MSVETETLGILSEMRGSTAARVDRVTQDLDLAWGRAWKEVAGEWEKAIDELVSSRVDGAWPPPETIRRARRAALALEATEKVMRNLEILVPARVRAELDGLIAQTTQFQRDLVASQYPPQAGNLATISSSFTRVDVDSVNAIIQRTSEQVQSRAWLLSSSAVEAMKTELFRGVAYGLHPNKAARLMLQRTEGAFNGGLARARVIARTEMLDAHRSASRAQQDRMRDVLQGWQWIATFDRRTCPSCLSLHGSEYPLTQAGPLDHQQGRCDRLPVTKSWKDLGFDVPEPPSRLPDAEAWFNGLPQSDREAIMGRDRLSLLDDGKIGWKDLSQRVDNRAWRPSFTPTPVKDLQTMAAAK